MSCDWLENTRKTCFKAISISNVTYCITLQALRDEISKNKALLDTLEDTGKEIIADSSEDPQVVRDVRGELNKIVSPVDAILRKLAERQVKLQNALLRSQEFQVQTDAYLENLCSVPVLLPDASLFLIIFITIC